MNDHVSYVCGFMFSSPKLDNVTSRKVILIKKNRPDFQVGKLNGVGGKVEESDESNHHAMVREFREETGVSTWPSDWKEFVTYKTKHSTIHFFRSVADVWPNPMSKTDEEVTVVPVFDLPTNILHNLRWLLPLALDPHIDLSLPLSIIE